MILCVVVLQRFSYCFCGNRKKVEFVKYVKKMTRKMVAPTLAHRTIRIQSHSCSIEFAACKDQRGRKSRSLAQSLESPPIRAHRKNAHTFPSLVSDTVCGLNHTIEKLLKANFNMKTPHSTWILIVFAHSSTG